MQDNKTEKPEQDDATIQDQSATESDTKQDDPKQNKKKGAEFKKLAEEYLDLAKRTKAEFENFKKRERESSTNAFNDGKVFACSVILPLLDAMLDAKKRMNPQETTDADKLDREGLEVLLRKFESGIASLGLTEIEISEDTNFDPRFHNAVATEEVAGTPPDKILEVWQKGFLLGGKVIRPAMVKVSK